MEYCRGDFKTVRAIQVDMKNYTNIFLGEKKSIFQRRLYSMNDTVCVKKID